MASRLRRVWLVTTGWSGGGHGVGKRIKLAHTRAALDAIHGGDLAGVAVKRDPVFGFDVVTSCSDAPSEFVWPRATRSDPGAYDAAAKKLAGLFVDNFRIYESGAGEAVRVAGPAI